MYIQNLYSKPGVNKERRRMEGMMEGGREREALQSPKSHNFLKRNVPIDLSTYFLVSLFLCIYISSSYYLFLWLSHSCLTSPSPYIGLSSTIISFGYGTQHLTWIPCMSIHNDYLHEQGQLNQWLQHYGPYPHTNLLLRKREMLYESPELL